MAASTSSTRFMASRCLVPMAPAPARAKRTTVAFPTQNEVSRTRCPTVAFNTGTW
jgi:hypothetical protein